MEEIQAGAKTDILIMASKNTMDDAADYIIPESRINMFGNHLYSADAGIGGDYSKKIADKVMLADKVGTCAAWVKSGDCEVGIIYSSDLYRCDGSRVSLYVQNRARRSRA